MHRLSTSTLHTCLNMFTSPNSRQKSPPIISGGKPTAPMLARICRQSARLMVTNSAFMNACMGVQHACTPAYSALPGCRTNSMFQARPREPWSCSQLVHQQSRCCCVCRRQCPSWPALRVSHAGIRMCMPDVLRSASSTATANYLLIAFGHAIVQGNSGTSFRCTGPFRATDAATFARAISDSSKKG